MSGLKVTVCFISLILTSSLLGQGNAGSKTIEILAENTEFVPKNDPKKPVEVRVGDTVKWTNLDGESHNVTFKSKNDKKLNLLDPKKLSAKGTAGASQQIRFDAALFKKLAEDAGIKDGKAVVKYKCTLHPGMDSTITLIIEKE